MQVLSLHMAPLEQIVLCWVCSEELRCCVAPVLQLNIMRASPFACGEITKRKAQHGFVGRSRSVRCAVALFQ